MTREEPMTNGFARIVLVQLNTDEQLNVREHEAIRVAIKALEQQTCEDAVSREAAIEAVNDIIADYVPNIFGRYEALPLEMASAINRLPSVNPQPKIGHWKEHNKPYDIDGTYYCYCDNCGGDAHEKTDFCPSCGAKMVDPQERSDEE